MTLMVSLKCFGPHSEVIEGSYKGRSDASMELLLGSKLTFFQIICIIDVSRRFAVKGQSVQIWRANRAISSHEIAETGECEVCYDPLLPLLNGTWRFQLLAQRP